MINKTEFHYFSPDNQEMLKAYAKEIWDEKTSDASPSWFSRITNYFPSSQTIGTQAGKAIAITHGAQFNNKVIDLVVDKFFKEEVKPLSYWEILKQKVTGVARMTLAESLKLNLTPQLMPFIQLAGGAACGITLPAVVGIMTLLYNKALSDPKTLNQLQKLSADQLLKMENGRFKDAFGRELTLDQTRIIQSLIAKYEMICQLSQIQNDEELVDFVEQNWMLIRKEEDKSDKCFYLNGQLIASEELQQIYEGIRQLTTKSDLTSFGRYGYSKELKTIGTEKVKTLIKLLTDSTHLRDLTTIDPDPKHWTNHIIQCEDSVYCIFKPFPGDERVRGTVLTEDLKEILGEFEQQDIDARKEEEKLEEFIQEEFTKLPIDLISIQNTENENKSA